MFKVYPLFDKLQRYMQKYVFQSHIRCGYKKVCSL